MKGDWVKNVKSDLSELKIDLLEEEIVSMTKKAFTNLINNNARNVAFEALKSKLRKKGKEIIYEGYYLQDYLKSSSGLNKQEMMDVFRLRTSTINIASFRPFKFGNSKNCQLGCLKNEDLEHLVSCDVFKIENLMIQNEEFKDFSFFIMQ